MITLSIIEKILVKNYRESNNYGKYLLRALAKSTAKQKSRGENEINNNSDNSACTTNNERDSKRMPDLEIHSI